LRVFAFALLLDAIAVWGATVTASALSLANLQVNASQRVVTPD
jgi:hypothetical protein